MQIVRPLLYYIILYDCIILFHSNSSRDHICVCGTLGEICQMGWSPSRSNYFLVIYIINSLGHVIDLPQISHPSHTIVGYTIFNDWLLFCQITQNLVLQIHCKILSISMWNTAALLTSHPKSELKNVNKDNKNKWNPFTVILFSLMSQWVVTCGCISVHHCNRGRWWWAAHTITVAFCSNSHSTDTSLQTRT